MKQLTPTNPSEIYSQILSNYHSYRNDSRKRIILMAGHAMPVPDFENNTLRLSLGSLVNDELRSLMQQDTMLTFSEYTFEIAARECARLKSYGMHVQIAILINDITHVKEVYDHVCNRINKDPASSVYGLAQNKIKTVKQLTEELLEPFYSDEKLPRPYRRSMDKYGLTLDDIVHTTTNRFYVTNTGKTKQRNEKQFCLIEKRLQDKFTEYVKGVPEYKEVFQYLKKLDIFMLYRLIASKIDPQFPWGVEMGVLEGDAGLKAEQAALGIIESAYPTFRISSMKKFCAKKPTADGEPGGIDCSKEVISFAGALIGMNAHISVSMPSLYKRPQEFKETALLLYVPMGCYVAVTFGMIVFDTLFKPEGHHIDFHVMPFASRAENTDFDILRQLDDVM